MKVQERILNLVGGFKLKNMGQKINPLGFRLGTTQNHHSFWKIKKYGIARIEKWNQTQGSEVITHIEIQKEIDTIHVIIHIGFPNLLKKKGAIEELEKDLPKEVNSVNQRLNIAIEKRIIKGIKIPNCGSIRCQNWIFNLVFQKSLKKEESIPLL
ncbi:hypothetical protein ACJX0J_003042 [Zea mays]